MTTEGTDGPDGSSPSTGTAGPGPDPERLRSAREGTVEDVTAMAAGRREQGWDALAVAAADTAREHQGVGEFFTHHRPVDGEHLDTVRHDGHHTFVPETEELAATVES